MERNIPVQQQRLHLIRFAMRNRRWWEARGLLAEAKLEEDWRMLGHASWEDYLAAAGVVRGRPQQTRV